ncbi:hypothetical protein [Pseudovibrio sp. W64]|nr:hypothetical protein [Pseudovibrio sp. W64]
MAQNKRVNETLVQQLTSSDTLLSFGVEQNAQIYKLLDQAFNNRQTAAFGTPQ